MTKFLCPDCSAILDVPKDVMEGEIISCSGCGLELVYNRGKLSQIELIGEDFGE
jgi:DNA-directed RNA polymerase subunit RPC12/RpoP